MTESYTYVQLFLGLAAGGILVQQFISGLIRAKEKYDGHDEAIARQVPVAYEFEEDREELGNQLDKVSESK